MKARLGVEMGPYVILGACNPLAGPSALEADTSVGALLPCNVVLRDDDGETIVEAMDPLAVLGIVDDPRSGPSLRRHGSDSSGAIAAAGA